MVVEVRGNRAQGIALLLALLVVLSLPGMSRAASGKVAISARSLARFEDQKLVIAKGDVEIHYQDVILQADEVKLHTDTKDLVATGNVVLKENKGSLACDKLEFNLDTKKGVAMRARGFFSPFYYLKGKEIEKVGPKKYVIEHGSFTTCESCAKEPEKSPDWSFKSTHMEVELGHSATIHNVTGWIKRIPVIYAPYLKIPLQNERKTGFLIPRVGYSKTKGTFVKVPFYWAISDYQDATFTLIPYSRGTLRGKVEYRYLRHLTGMTSGSLSSHIQRLELKGLVQVDRRFVGRRGVTEIGLTEKGWRELRRYLSSIRRVLDVVLRS